MWCRLHAFHYFFCSFSGLFGIMHGGGCSGIRHSAKNSRDHPNTLLCASAYEYGAQAFIMCCVPTDTPFTSSPA